MVALWLPFFSTIAEADEIGLQLQTDIIDPTLPSNGTNRGPIRVPSLYIEDHTLSFSSACVGYTLELIQDGETVYSFSITDTDDLVLPDYLCGQFEIRLVGASFTFVGEIEL